MTMITLTVRLRVNLLQGWTSPLQSSTATAWTMRCPAEVNTAIKKQPHSGSYSTHNQHWQEYCGEHPTVRNCVLSFQKDSIVLMRLFLYCCCIFVSCGDRYLSLAHLSWCGDSRTAILPYFLSTPTARNLAVPHDARNDVGDREPYHSIDGLRERNVCLFQNAGAPTPNNLPC